MRVAPNPIWLWSLQEVKKVRNIARSVESLLSMREFLGLIPSTV